MLYEYENNACTEKHQCCKEKMKEKVHLNINDVLQHLYNDDIKTTL